MLVTSGQDSTTETLQLLKQKEVGEVDIEYSILTVLMEKNTLPEWNPWTEFDEKCWELLWCLEYYTFD